MALLGVNGQTWEGHEVGLAYLHIPEALGEVSVDAVGGGQDVAVVDECPAAVPLRFGCVCVEGGERCVRLKVKVKGMGKNLHS